MERYIVRRFREADAEAVSALIEKTVWAINAKVYEPAAIHNFLKTVTPEEIIKRAAWTHYYVVCDGDKVICSGAIGPHCGLEDESEFFNVFLLPEYHRRGIGRMLVEALERDPYFLRARRIFVHASITAIKFYQRMGYDHVGGELAMDEFEFYRLEKLRQPIR